MPGRPRVLVVGGGPAGLSAGVHLLEQSGGDVEVVLHTMGHFLGGKAAAWRDSEGYSIDHGFHAVFGFYEEMRSLARRAGVDLKRALVDSKGVSHYFDPRDGTLFTLQLSRHPLITLGRIASFPGLAPRERAQLADALVRIGRTLARIDNRETLDDVCYRAFLLEHGAPASFLGHPMYRQVQELAFHHPHEVSTYIALKGAELVSHCYDDARFFYIAGNISELFWIPIASYFDRLGGSILTGRKLIGLEHQKGRLVGARFGVPDNEAVHRDGMHPWPNEVPIQAESEFTESGFSAVICTLPPASFAELDLGEGPWREPFFANVRKLRSVSTLSLQLWTKEPLRSPVRGSVLGLPLPLGYALDYKPLIEELKRDGRFGAALEWVGVEAGAEEVPDPEVIAKARAGLARVRGFEGSDRHSVVRAVLRRNRANHQRYLLTEPGTLRFRPTVRTPLGGLYLAGDWVRNEIDIPSMEGAIRSGKDAARAVLEDL